MKGNQIGGYSLHPDKLILILALITFGSLVVVGQSSPAAQPPASASPTVTNTAPANTAPAPVSNSTSVAVTKPTVPSVQPAATAAEAEALRKRIERARALAAAHQLPAATGELESIRASAKDDVSRILSSLMLMSIYLEDGNYARSESMLEEAFKQRTASNEASVRTYFGLAGQAVNGARTHIGRYRGFGIDVSKADLPPEALSDLDRLGSLLDRLAAQAKDLIKENSRSNDAFALLEDISSIRVSLCRNREDRMRWENEFSASRAKLQTLPAENSVTTPSLSSLMAQATTQPIVTTGRGSASEPTVQQSSEPPATVTSTVPAAQQTPTVQAPANPQVNPVPNKGVNPSFLEVGSLFERATKKVVPTYPPAARNSGASGLVRIKLVVDESGSVANIVWTEGPIQLRQAAQDAVRQWKFQPTIVDGKPVRVAGYVDFGFNR